MLVSPISCQKVLLGVYYETLCPTSFLFILDNLTSIFDDGIIDIVNLHLVPWGNAKLKDDSSLECQVLDSFIFLSMGANYLLAIYKKWYLVIRLLILS